MLLKTLSNLDDLDYYGKKVLMRVDFNVTIGKDNEIGEDYRIRMTIPTIEYLVKRSAKLILISHLGRPNKKKSTKKMVKFNNTLHHVQIWIWIL